MQPLTRADRVPCTLELPRALVEEARELGRRTGLTRSHIVSLALDGYLRRHARPLPDAGDPAEPIQLHRETSSTRRAKAPTQEK